MPRTTYFSSPLLLGFDEMDRMLERLSKAGSDGYPPYNIEKIGENEFEISFAVAGFTQDELNVEVGENQLTVRGKQTDAGERVFLHRGIAARQFQRQFLLADGMEVVGASLDNGILSVRLTRPQPAATTRTIEIRSGQDTGKPKGFRLTARKAAE